MATEYGRRLRDIPGLCLPVTRPWAESVHWMYAVRLADDFPLSRFALRAALADRGVETREFFPSCAGQPMVRSLVGVQGPFPISERIAEQGFYLPSGLALTVDQLEHVCAALHDAVRNEPSCA